MTYFTEKAQNLANSLENIKILYFKDKIKYFIYRTKRYIKHLYQHITRGFSDKETWNLDHTMAEFILPRLKRFRELKQGVPIDLEEEEWEEILDKIELSLLGIIKEWEPDDTGNVKFLTCEDMLEIQEGLSLLAKYCRGMWW